ncbi:UNVERIFIED_CONTAM: hypothetical protein PYX00_005637 [Menopon gallinae]|uniref:RING finger protein 141 n=1 Tax=Menopon gallinae TaxID=328185 RepID=A0AAW2HSD1_9NEOP
MGQSSSGIYGSTECLIPETVGIIQDEVIRQARVLTEIVTLSYDDFLVCLKQLNTLSRKVTGEDGKQLLFAVKKGTDSTVLWKGTVKIACVKLDAQAKQIETYRLLNLNQFLKVFRTLQCQLNAALQSAQSELSPSHRKKLGERSTDSASDTASSYSDDSGSSYHESGSDNSDSSKSKSSTTKQEAEWDSKRKRPSAIKLAATHKTGFTASLLLEEVDHLTSEFDNAGDKLVECSICMERKPDVLLPCAHAYCMPCIEQWNTSHKTCPFCRETLNSTDDTWVISDIPGSQEISREICSALMDLTSSPE